MPTDPITDLTIETADDSTVRDGDHVIESTVEVFEVYEQRYDPDQDRVIITSSTTEDKENGAFTQYECSCGETFFDQTAAHKHLIDAANDAG